MTRRIPILETERLLIRELTMDDLDDIHYVLNHAFCQNTAIAKREQWLEWTVLGYEMFSKLNQPPYGERAVVHRETMELIGVVGIVPCLGKFIKFETSRSRGDGLATAEVGLFWAVEPSYQNNGYATEAAFVLVDHLFKDEKLNRIIATTECDNLPSQKVIKKLGMTVHFLDQQHPLDQLAIGVLENNLLT